jgi:dolichol-phosphate mannosyltransferase
MSSVAGEWGRRDVTGRKPPVLGGGVVRLPAYPKAEATSFLPRAEVGYPMPSTLSILLPALNEARGVRSVIRGIPRHGLRRLGFAYDVYVLDGHSTDGTRSVARQMGAKVVVQSGNGKGAAVREFLPKIGTDATVLLDSDGTYPPEMIPQFVGALGNGIPVVLGSRFRGSKIDDGAMTPVNRLGNRLLSKFASVLYGVPVSDVCSGMWAFQTDCLRSLNLTAEGFELEVDFFAECALRRIPIAEIPIPFQRRIGERKLRLREGLRIAFALLKKRLRSPRAYIEGLRRDVEAPAAESADGGG